MFLGNHLLSRDSSGVSFPAGMRVLAVDNNQTCLKLLETMLHNCHYNVTTTTQSALALEMLRKHRNDFDLVICEVNMPDIDGFQLLQQVQLEMNLPVVMLSEYNDKELVRKSILLGACAFLLKPVRIEELRNIWQHVVRRNINCSDQNKTINEENISNMAGEGTQVIMVPENWKKVDCNDWNKALNDEEKICNVAGEVTKGMEPENNDVQNKILGKNRKEQSDENEELSSGNKPRLVWTAELHTHFLAAINQLGLNWATPKRILELMNVEGLSRTHVASHLQKYKRDLKRPTKQARASMAPAFDGQFGRKGFSGLTVNPASDLSGSSSLVQPIKSLQKHDSPPFKCNVNQTTGESQSSEFPAISSTSTVVGPLQDADETPRGPTLGIYRF